MHGRRSVSVRSRAKAPGVALLPRSRAWFSRFAPDFRMILDTLSQSASYQQLGPRFAAGLKWLGEFSPATADGRYDIDGDDVFALVQSYDTVPSTEKKYESH